MVRIPSRAGSHPVSIPDKNDTPPTVDSKEKPVVKAAEKRIVDAKAPSQLLDAFVAQKMKHPGEQQEKLQTGEQLARQLTPKNTAACRILLKSSNIQVIAETQRKPAGRYETNYATHGDEQLQDEVQKLIERGVITNKTLILSNTGHDIPILAQLLTQEALAVQGVFHFGPPTQNESSSVRLRDQAQTWGDEIEAAQSGNSEQKGALFIGVDKHRPKERAKVSLPDETALKEYGITKVVVLMERPTNKTPTLEGNLDEDLVPWVQSIKSLPVQLYNIDERQNNAPFTFGEQDKLIP